MMRRRTTREVVVLVVFFVKHYVTIVLDPARRIVFKGKGREGGTLMQHATVDYSSRDLPTFTIYGQTSSSSIVINYTKCSVSSYGMVVAVVS